MGWRPITAGERKDKHGALSSHTDMEAAASCEVSEGRERQDK